MFQSAMPGPEQSIQYMDASSTLTIRREGSRSWRHNNPGLIGHGLFAIQHGAIGMQGRAAIFASEAAGRKALIAMLGHRNLEQLTVEQAYQRFHPAYQIPEPEPAASPTAVPPPKLCPHTGLEAEAPINTVSGADHRRMADTIQHQLIGYQEGIVTREDMRDGGLNQASRAASGTNLVINGRTAVHAGSQGRLVTPDVCKRPSPKGCKVALYSNQAVSADATGTASSVLVNGHPVCTRISSFARSSGDEAGSCGGLVSGTVRGKAEFITASQDVFMEGEPAVRQFDLMVSNNRNTPPMPLMQPGAPPPPGLEATGFDVGEADPSPWELPVRIEAERTDRLLDSVRIEEEERP